MITIKTLSVITLSTLLLATSAYAQTLEPGTKVTTTTTTRTLQAPINEDVRNSTTTTTTVIQPPATETITVKETVIYGQELANILKNEPKAQRFHNLLVSSGLDQTLDSPKGFTAFVPYDSAFEGSAIGSTHTPGVVDPAARSFVEKFIVDSKFDTNLLHGQRDYVKTRSGEKINIGKGNKGVYYANGIKIQDTLKTPQGIVYFTDTPVVK